MNIQQVAIAETRDEIQNVIAHLQTAQTGDEILMILDAITDNIEQEDTEEDSE